MYQTGYWRSIRRNHLTKHPLCACCLSKGRVTQAHHVDHVFPWTALGEGAFYHNIFQSLCASCHSEKTYYEQKNIIKYYGYGDYSIEDYQRLCKTGK